VEEGKTVMKELMSLQNYLEEELNNSLKASDNDSKGIVEVELYVHELRQIIKLLQAITDFRG